MLWTTFDFRPVNAWEKRKLGSIGKIKSGSGFPSIEQGGKQGIPFYKVSDMNTSGNKNSMVISQNYVTSAQLKKRKWTPITNTPAIIFAKVGAAIFLDRKRVVEHPFLIDNNMMAYIVGDAWNLRFCQAFFQSIPLLKFAQTGALPSLNAHDIGRIPVHLPTRYEQKEIGDLIYKVTRLIAATQDKLEKLSVLQRGFLQHFFAQTWRFSGYSHAWENYRLGDVATRVRGNDGRMNLPILTISAGKGWLTQEQRFSQNIAGNELKKYTLLSKGELSYNHGNSKLAEYGAVFVLKQFKEALVPRVYHSFNVSGKADPDFIEYLFESGVPNHELRKLISSGARMDGLLNINYDSFMNISVRLPSIEEQNKIARVLEKLKKLTDETRLRLFNLQQAKKSLLRMLFP